jgi:hypothetical protein
MNKSIKEKSALEPKRILPKHENNPWHLFFLVSLYFCYLVTLEYGSFRYIGYGDG